MKWLLQLLLFITCYSSILSLENCNKMWGMSNEINGIQVSKIGIYMCVDDPLNIYKSSINTGTSNMVLNNENINIIQTLLNNTNISNTNYTNFTTTLLPTTTTLLPTTTTLLPTTTTSLPTTTSTSPPTTTSTSPPTTTSTSPPSTSTSLPTTTSSLTTLPDKNKTSQISYTNVNSNINEKPEKIYQEIDNTHLIIVSIVTSLTSLCCCCCLCYMNKNKIITKCSNLVITLKNTKNKNESNVPKLQSPPKKQKRKIKPSITKPSNTNMPPIPILDDEESQTRIDIPRALTPVNNQRLKLSSDILNVTTPKTNEWYKHTFQNEINLVRDAIDNPSAPSTDSPKPYKQPVNNKVHTRVKNIIHPNNNNKPKRKIPLKQEFRGYSNSWGKKDGWK